MIGFGDSFTRLDCRLYFFCSIYWTARSDRKLVKLNRGISDRIAIFVEFYASRANILFTFHREN